jgi:predicted phage replisome organizer
MNIGWIKLDINILNDTKIKLIRKFPDGDKLIVLWLGLLCLAMKSDLSGYIYITEGIPYTPDELATEFDIEPKTVELGLSLFKKYNMIDLTEGGIIEVINFNKHQQLDKIEASKESNRLRQARYRKKQQLLLNPDSNANVTVSNDTDKKRKDNIRKEKKIIDKPVKHKYGEYKHVLLSDKDYTTLITLYTKYGADQRIKNLDEYIETTKKTYHNHCLVIQRWEKKNEKSGHSNNFKGTGAETRQGEKPTKLSNSSTEIKIGGGDNEGI